MKPGSEMLQEAIETISTAIEKFPKKWDVPPTHSHARTDARKHEHTLARSLARSLADGARGGYWRVHARVVHVGVDWGKKSNLAVGVAGVRRGHGEVIWHSMAYAA